MKQHVQQCKQKKRKKVHTICSICGISEALAESCETSHSEYNAAVEKWHEESESMDEKIEEFNSKTPATLADLQSQLDDFAAGK